MWSPTLCLLPLFFTLCQSFGDPPLVLKLQIDYDADALLLLGLNAAEMRGLILSDFSDVSGIFGREGDVGVQLMPASRMRTEFPLDQRKYRLEQLYTELVRKLSNYGGDTFHVILTGRNSTAGQTFYTANPGRICYPGSCTVLSLISANGSPKSWKQRVRLIAQSVLYGLGVAKDINRCSCGNQECILTDEPAISNVFPSCVKTQLQSYADNRRGTCRFLLTGTASPLCGNGLKEGSERCDCLPNDKKCNSCCKPCRELLPCTIAPPAIDENAFPTDFPAETTPASSKPSNLPSSPATISVTAMPSSATTPLLTTTKHPNPTTKEIATTASHSPVVTDSKPVATPAVTPAAPATTITTAEKTNIGLGLLIAISVAVVVLLVLVSVVVFAIVRSKRRKSKSNSGSRESRSEVHLSQVTSPVKKSKSKTDSPKRWSGLKARKSPSPMSTRIGGSEVKSGTHTGHQLGTVSDFFKN